jgi:hypothetical protein
MCAKTVQQRAKGMAIQAVRFETSSTEMQFLRPLHHSGAQVTKLHLLSKEWDGKAQVHFPISFTIELAGDILQHAVEATEGRTIHNNGWNGV